MAKMRVLKPQIDKINEKYPADKDKVQKQQAIMNLYREAGASPLGGCVPVIVQMPILFAMFRFFQHLLSCVEKASCGQRI